MKLDRERRCGVGRRPRLGISSSGSETPAVKRTSTFGTTGLGFTLVAARRGIGILWPGTRRRLHKVGSGTLMRRGRRPRFLSVFCCVGGGDTAEVGARNDPNAKSNNGGSLKPRDWDAHCQAEGRRAYSCAQKGAEILRAAHGPCPVRGETTRAMWRENSPTAYPGGPPWPAGSLPSNNSASFPALRARVQAPSKNAGRCPLPSRRPRKSSADW